MAIIRGPIFSTVPVSVSQMPSQRVALLSMLGVLAAWTLAAQLLNGAPAPDSVELFGWAQSLQWGYVKHPPLPVFLIALGDHLADPAPWMAYAWAFACLAITGGLTIDIARLLLGTRVAVYAGLLWTLVQYFSWRAYMFNHNTVLVMCVALTVWLALHALRQARPGPWALVGAAAAAALLSKYQAIVPLLCLLGVLVWSGRFRQLPVRRGVVVACVVTAVLMVPHVLWLVANGFPTFRYASESLGADLSSGERLSRVASFLAVQLRANAAMLALAAIVVLPGPRDVSRVPLSQSARVWFAGLVGAPLLIVIALCLIFGVDLQAAWGMQTLQFACIPVAAWIEQSRGESGFRPILRGTLAVHAVSLLLFSLASIPMVEDSLGLRTDRMYPARELARAIEAESSLLAPCRVNLIVGPPFEAGLVSLYLANHPRVLVHDRPGWSPAVDEKALDSGVAVYLQVSAPAGASVLGNGLWRRSEITAHTPREASIHWTLATRAAECDRNAWF